MVNENLIPKVEEIREIKNEIPTYEEFMKTYKSDDKVSESFDSENNALEKGYGPCKNTLCGCSCSSTYCVCERVGKDGFFGYSAAGKKKEGFFGKVTGEAASSLYTEYSSCNGEVRIIGGSVGATADKDGFKIRASADLINVKTEGVQVRAGVGIDTGISTEDGLEAKLIGFGFSVGKKTGISTPLGEIKVDTEDCVIQ